MRNSQPSVMRTERLDLQTVSGNSAAMKQVLVVPRHFDKFTIKRMWTCLRSEKTRLGYGREKLADFVLETILKYGERTEIRYENGSRFETETEAFPNALTLENFLNSGLRIYKAAEEQTAKDRPKSTTRTLSLLYIFMAAIRPASIRTTDGKTESSLISEYVDGVDEFTSMHDLDEDMPSAMRLYRHDMRGRRSLSEKYNAWTHDKKRQFRDDLWTNSSRIEKYSNELFLDFDSVLISCRSDRTGKREYQLIPAHIWEHMLFDIFLQSTAAEQEDEEFRRYSPLEHMENFDPNLRRQRIAMAVSEQVISYPGRSNFESIEIEKPRTCVLAWRHFDGSDLLISARGLNVVKAFIDPADEYLWPKYVDYVFRQENFIDFYSEFRGKSGTKRMRTASIALPLTPDDKKVENFLLKSMGD